MRSQSSVISNQESEIRRLFLFILPTPHTPLPTPPNLATYDRRIQLTTVKNSFIGKITQQLRGLF
ncbi:hypothetical protein BFG60_3758 [Microcystis aeruginosa NIES-98]|nr:hypothetical protein BFG60_3758 [Microcystis aeruginosa NIES-98]ROI09429.1 hypothetical protein ED562_06500 [Microcystis aeruginosa FACHB-524]